MTVIIGLSGGIASGKTTILRFIKKQNIPINPVIVISNKPTASGLRIAKRFNIKTEKLLKIKNLL